MHAETPAGQQHLDVIGARRWICGPRPLLPPLISILVRSKACSTLAMVMFDQYPDKSRLRSIDTAQFDSMLASLKTPWLALHS